MYIPLPNIGVLNHHRHKHDTSNIYIVYTRVAHICKLSTMADDSSKLDKKQGSDKRKAAVLSPDTSQPRLRRRGSLPDLHSEPDPKKTFSLPDLIRKGFKDPEIVQDIAPSILKSLKPSIEETIARSIEKSMTRQFAHASFLLKPFPFLVSRFFPENSNLGITGRITWFIRVDN